MAEISVSLLNLEKENAIRKMYDLETARVDYFHIDVMDGKFVSQDTTEKMKDYSVALSNITNVGLDVHLMVEEVEEFVEEYLDFNPQYITFHIESTKTEEKTMNIIKKIKENGVKVGLAISPNTSIEEIKSYLNYIHMVLIMTVEPGVGGQKLIPETLEKVKELKKYIEKKGLSVDIETDGGIKGENAKQVIESGSDILVIGTYLVNSENPKEEIFKIKRIGEK